MFFKLFLPIYNYYYYYYLSVNTTYLYKLVELFQQAKKNI